MTTSKISQAPSTADGMGLFERFLSVWVALAIIAGVLLGQFAPAIPEALSRFEYAQVSIPVAVLITDTALHAALLIAVGLFLLVVEVLNSAIEAVVDRIGTERHELSRKAKDLGSLAVLLSTLLLAVVWLAALWQWALG